MKLRRVQTGSDLHLELLAPQGWVAAGKAIAAIPPPSGDTAVRWGTDIVALLGAPADVREAMAVAARDVDPEATREADVVIPFAPRSYRDFMLFEAHAINAARGFVNRLMPRAAPIVRTYEKVTGTTFPKLRPHALWYRQPIYYMGNHLTFVTDADDVTVPSYSRALDYELELGFVLAHPLLDAGSKTAEAAIGGFVVLNDFSARDVQLAEMASGLGPQKAKHFCSAISKVVVTADEILPRWRDLKGHVRLNGERVAEPATAGARWSLGEMLAHASRCEPLQTGEFFGSGTLPSGSGIETGRLLEAGDTIEIGIEGIGTLTNRIVAGGAS
jgi:2-keto-4-pentenoate hydratase/2-oxohepta-3-ene-1,7-dioic acid hydratase in catechol pathway